ncbi:glycosyltransferase [Aromatoleum toluvorans]|uniref:Glycosyltransferase n=1 Tax=Aromatoleum toluvorans TaxID=92002 RepID=A0ABX1Q0V7_9RHOO|nr:glycosyltransferase [Aromatoleum toluvorans]
MKISIVIPAHNAAALIGGLLDSLEGLRLDGVDGCEIIVVDDGSSDGTAPLLDRRPAVRVLRHERCAGAGAARNTGARAACGEWLVFLDADTRIRDRDFLRRCVALAARHPEYDAFSGCYHDENPGGGRFARYLDACETVMRRGSLDRSAPACLGGSVCAIRRSVFLELGGFSEDRRVALEDPELGCRLAAAGHRLWLSGELRVEHRQPRCLDYLRELVPRTRHYLQLIRRYRSFNPMMGGAGEGIGRGALVLGLLLAPGGIVSPALLAAALLLLGVAGWQGRALARELARRHGFAFVLPGFAFHALASAAIVAGGLLALRDIAAHTLRSRAIDLAVVLAYLRSLLSRGSPGYLIQFLTHRCNAHCGHCFDMPQRHAIGRDRELDLARIRRVAASTGPVGHLSLTGGEPLLRDDLVEILAAYYGAGVRSFSVSTNGSYPEKIAALVARLAGIAPFGRVMVTVSVDGVGAAHDRLRGVPGLFAKVEHSLRLLCEARQWLPQLRVHACIAATGENVQDVPAIVARLRRFPLDQLEITRLRGTPADPAVQGIDDATYARAGAAVAAANGGATGLSRVFALLDRAMYMIVRSPDEPWPCGSCLAGRRLAVIRADGAVLPCEMIRDVRAQDASTHGDFIIGRLDDHGDDLRALLDGPQARRITDYIRDSQCRCSFECAIFATMSYRPWTLPRFLLHGAGSLRARLVAPQRGEAAAERESQQQREDPRRDQDGEHLGEFLRAEQRREPAREQPVLFAPRAALPHVGPQPGRSRHDQREVVQEG